MGCGDEPVDPRDDGGFVRRVVDADERAAQHAGAAALEQARQDVELPRLGNGDDSARQRAVGFGGRRAHLGWIAPRQRALSATHLRRAATALPASDGLQAREFDDGARLDAIEVEIGVVLTQQPDGHVVRARCENPQRLAGLDDVAFDFLDLIGGEEVALYLLVIRAASLLEGRCVDAAEVERQVLAEHDGFAERQRVQIAQPLRREPRASRRSARASRAPAR